jgi:integration host factor subunit alpha
MDSALNSSYGFNDRGRLTLTTTVTRAMLGEAAAERTGLSKNDTALICDAMFALIGDRLKECETVKLTSFGSFQVRSRAERVGRNPRTGTEHSITPRHTVVFTPSAQLRDALKAKVSTNKVANRSREEASV